jgi:signal transduction histidine kinase
MKPLKNVVLLCIFVLCPLRLSAETEHAQPSSVTPTELADAERRADNWRIAFFVMTAFYIFVYIMGRRRLMRKIWARNKALRTALDKAQESDRLKMAFIRNMSHEIRTPLNAINGFSQLLCNPEFELSKEERHDMMQRITKSCDTITGIVGEVLDMSEGESQHDRMTVAVNALCSEMLDELKQSNAKGLDLQFSTSLPNDFTVDTNEPNLRRIIKRILDNAMKFTEKGSIILSSEAIGHHLVLGVADTGIGIAPANHERIFENFTKLDDYVEGVGLGLPLSRRLARMLGGDVTYDKTYVGGSRFLISIPIKG